MKFFASLFASDSFRFHFFSLFGMFRLHANKAKKHTFFRFIARAKFPTFSLIFASSEYERRTLGTVQLCTEKGD
jgi:hypothetical protein